MIICPVVTVPNYSVDYSISASENKRADVSDPGSGSVSSDYSIPISKKCINSSCCKLQSTDQIFLYPKPVCQRKKVFFQLDRVFIGQGGARRAPISSQIVSYASVNRGPVFQFAGVTSGVSSTVRCIFFRFFHFFTFFRFFRFFSLNFRFTSIFSLNFRLFFLRFCFRFLVFHIKVNHVKIRLFFRFQAKRNFRFNFKFRFRSESEGAP